MRIEGKEIKIILTYMRERRRENWTCIEVEVEENKGTPIIIGGDFNARTAEEGGRLTGYNSHRTSRDKIGEIGIRIMNGGAKDTGVGEFTYIGGGRKSTIDYVMMNEEGNEIIEELIVGTNTESDHQPIMVKLNKEAHRREVKQKEKTIDWTENAVTEFKEKLAKESKTKDWRELKRKIQKGYNGER